MMESTGHDDSVCEVPLRNPDENVKTITISHGGASQGELQLKQLVILVSNSRTEPEDHSYTKDNSRLVQSPMMDCKAPSMA